MSKLTVLASGDGTTFEHLAKCKSLNAKINLLITNNANAGCIQRAIKLNVHYVITNNVWAHVPKDTTLVILAGWMKLLTVPEEWEGRILNIHPSLLPAYGGKGFYGINVHEAVLKAGEATTGCTVHVVDNEYDHGKILHKVKVGVKMGDTPETLQRRVQDLEKQVYPQVINSYLDKINDNSK